jgi:tetratricopeptide (TPR) repeat protein
MAERLRVGPMLIQQGRARDAAEVYEELAKWRQDLPEVWAGGARCLLEQRRWQEAADSARKSIEIEGTAEARELLREAMVKLGKGEPNA